MGKPAHKYIQVENRIKEAIRHREIVDKLPGERVLAKEFGVSYMTIRKAVENLVTQSILYKVPARGTYVDQRGTVKRIVHRLGYFFDSGLR
ncbi:MAG: winged helix-turn-helix domain-containing protein [Gammaproteobacteria bacterium]|jgi:DNA-binding GntR family transcriptional regulator|nr:winged helix-turn-helix domain-containing protein [Gammaproteobacteria bacterium]